MLASIIESEKHIEKGGGVIGSKENEGTDRGRQAAATKLLLCSLDRGIERKIPRCFSSSPRKNTPMWGFHLYISILGMYYHIHKFTFQYIYIHAYKSHAVSKGVA